MRPLPVLLVPVLLATAATAQDERPGFAVRYRCDGGVTLQVAYLNPPGGPSLAVVAYDGALIPMEAGPTGSGVRYVAYDREAGHVWHTKGDEGLLARDHGAAQTMLVGNCVAQGG